MWGNQYVRFELVSLATQTAVPSIYWVAQRRRSTLLNPIPTRSVPVTRITIAMTRNLKTKHPTSITAWAACWAVLRLLTCETLDPKTSPLRLTQDSVGRPISHHVVYTNADEDEGQYLRQNREWYPCGRHQHEREKRRVRRLHMAVVFDRAATINGWRAIRYRR